MPSKFFVRSPKRKKAENGSIMGESSRVSSHSVVSQRSRQTGVSMSSKTTSSRTAVKKIGSKMIKKMKTVGRRKDKKRKGAATEESSVAVPDTVSTPKNHRPNGTETTEEKESGDDVSTKGGGHKLIHVILFLMNPNTRKFEILLLDFDASKARVKELLAQVPTAANEESFRTQRFSGVANADGREMIDSHRLSQYASDWTVAVAIPDGMTSKECVEVAEPIMKDPRVKELVCSLVKLRSRIAPRKSSCYSLLK